MQKRKPKHPKCQLIYVVGIEGVMHHGFWPILKTLIEGQIDTDGNPFKIYYNELEILKVMNFTDGGIYQGVGVPEDELHKIKPPTEDQRKAVMMLT